MAPHMLRDYHSTEDPDRYPLRTTRRSESNVAKTHHIDTSQINGKEDFFRCMGLQMSRLKQHRYKMSSDNYGSKVANIPVGVTLRDCSVVVLGVKCKLCGKCFKCETDVNMHMNLKHFVHLTKNTSTDTNETHCAEYRDKICEILSDPFECGTVTTGKDSRLKLHNKFRLILKIGKEVVTKISVKRKHLRMNMSTQTESDDGAEIVDKEGYESNVPDIDPLGFRNSPCEYCDPTLYAVNSTNQYLVSNIVPTEGTVHEKNAAFKGRIASATLTETRATSVDTICSKNCSATQIPSRTLSHSSVLNEESYEFEEPCSKSSWNSERKTHDHTPVINDTNVMSKENNTNEKQRDINANETFMDTSKKELKNAINQIFEDSEVSQLRLKSSQHQTAPPLQLLSSQSHSPLPQQSSILRRHSMPPEVPVISQPHSTSPKPSSRCRRQSAPPEQPLTFHQPSTPPQRTSLSQHPPIFDQLSTLQQSSTPSQRLSSQEQTATPINDRTDDEIQEVLRIIRGYNNNNNNKEINHESPNRHEQELLLRDVIEDMKKMEERGLHLLEKTFAKKRKQAPRKSNVKNSGMDNESAKSNHPTKRKRTSNTKEQTRKIQNQNNVSVEDILKENLMVGNANFNSMHEMLRGYGIHFCNDILEVNNNMKNIQEPVNRFLAPCAGGMENGSNRPIVIDLVNDTTE